MLLLFIAEFYIDIQTIFLRVTTGRKYRRQMTVPVKNIVLTSFITHFNFGCIKYLLLDRKKYCGLKFQ